MVPSAFTLAVPCAGGTTRLTLASSIPPAGASCVSVSFAVTSMITAVSSFVDAVSGMASGASFTGATLIVTVA